MQVRRFALDLKGKTITLFDEDATRVFDASFVPQDEPITRHLVSILAQDPIRVIPLPRS